MAEIYATIESAVAARGAALMGVVNVTPDSFFDGGRYLTEDAARGRVDEVVGAGATLVDVGGESSRPGAPPVAAGEQKARVEAALRQAALRGVVASIDTTSPEVAEFALSLGARVVNDVSCLADEGLARVAARSGAALILTHSRGPMAAMRGFSDWPDDDYGDVVEDVLADWNAARARAVRVGMPAENVWLDPGYGFSKNARQSLELLARTAELRHATPVLVVGPGRKSFLASVDPAPPEQRLGGTIAACLVAAERGAQVLRVHDVREVRQALTVARAARPPRPEEGAVAR